MKHTRIVLIAGLIASMSLHLCGAAVAKDEQTLRVSKDFHPYTSIRELAGGT